MMRTKPLKMSNGGDKKDERKETTTKKKKNSHKIERDGLFTCKLDKTFPAFLEGIVNMNTQVFSSFIFIYALQRLKRKNMRK